MFDEPVFVLYCCITATHGDTKNSLIDVNVGHTYFKERFHILYVCIYKCMYILYILYIYIHICISLYIIN